MADTSEPQTAPKNHPLLEALQDPTFRDALADAITKPLGDDRDAEITALLKSKGLDSMTEEQILSILNPPVADSDPTKQPGQDGDAKPSAPPFAFSFALYEARYTITSASHPDGVFEIQVGGDGTVTMGENGKAFKATPELDNRNNWWLRWGDKAAGDWFSVQFFSAIPQVGDDKTPSLTFKGTWHTKKDGKAVDLDFSGKYNHVARKDTSEKVAKNFKYAAVGLIAYLLTVGVIMHFMQRRLRLQAAARREAIEQNAEHRRVMQVAEANQVRLVQEQEGAQDRRGNDVAQEYLTNLPKEAIASFEATLTEEMKKVVDDYYQDAERKRLWEAQQGEPPKAAIQEQIKAVISEQVKGLIRQTQADLTSSFNSKFGEGLPADVKERLAREVEGKIEKHAIDTLMTPEGAYQGLAKLAFDRVTAFKYAEHVKTTADEVMHKTTELIRLKNRDNANSMFGRLIEYSERLQSAQRDGQEARLVAEHRERLEREVTRLNADLATNVDMQKEMTEIQTFLERQEGERERVREAGEVLEGMDNHEKREREAAEHAMRNLRRRPGV